MDQVRVVIRSEYADTYRNIPVTAFLFNVSEKGIEITAFVDEEDHTPAEMPQPNSVYVKRRIETRLSINPFQAKALYDMLGRNLKDYQDVFGKIAPQDEIQQRASEKQKETGRGVSKGPTSTKPSSGVQ
jgi:hypothetical protein